MALTRLDCHLYRGARAELDGSSFVVLNPSQKPGTVVVSCAAAVRTGIGSQVACKLSLEHFVNGVLDFYGKPHDRAQDTVSSVSVEVLEAAFKSANTSVYEFGHKLAAGGRLAACLLGLVIEDDVIAAGRAGAGSAYLFRQGELFPFFETKEIAQGEDTWVGSQSLVTVELASVPIQESDRLVVFSQTLRESQEERLRHVLSDAEELSAEVLELVVKNTVDAPHELAFACAAQLGPKTIYLSEPLPDGLPLR